MRGEEHDDRCPQEKATILWCIGYEIGYNDGYYDSRDFRGKIVEIYIYDDFKYL